MPVCLGASVPWCQCALVPVCLGASVPGARVSVYQNLTNPERAYTSFHLQIVEFVALRERLTNSLNFTWLLVDMNLLELCVSVHR